MMVLVGVISIPGPVSACFNIPPGRLYLGLYLDTGINGRRDGCIIWASQLGEVLLLGFNLAEGLGQGTGGEGLHC